MIHTIRTSKVSKIIASYLAIQLMLTTVQPSNLFALTSGPSQPEFNAFTPIGTSDMVNLSTGDFNYNIPIMDVGGYPLNLAYDSGVTMDQEASWVGLGWNLNVGQINRQVRGIPDDFKGDTLTYEKNLKKHITVGINAELDAQIFGIEKGDTEKKILADTTSFGGVSLGLGVKYSNYHGISFTPSYGLSFDLSNNISVGMDVQTSATEGVTISPSVNAKADLAKIKKQALTGKLNAGLSFNSNRGLSTFNLGASLNTVQKTGVTKGGKDIYANFSSSGSGSISFSGLTLTPRKRSSFQDFNGTFSYSFGADIWGADGEIELSATASVQKLKDTYKEEKAYGYEFTGQATQNDILDYNRENDRTISENILALPYTNYTYDLYSVNGQGINGMFRPHRSQVGQIYDEYVKDESSSFNLGVEFEGGTGWHLGANLVTAPSESYTGAWETRASNTFKNENETTRNASSNLDYEPVYFKYVGENKVDNERALYTETLHGDKAMALKISGDAKFDRYADTRFRVKTYELNSNIPVKPEPLTPSFSGKLKRTTRDVRNQSIQKITKEELSGFYGDPDYAVERTESHPFAKAHHTVEMRVLKPDGATYVFGETAYNTEKHEVAFATDSIGGCDTGIVNYNPGNNTGPDIIDPTSGENTRGNNTKSPDRFYDRVITPDFAHTYLLSSVLSSDYEDLTGNGPTDDDLGAYTKFEYYKPNMEEYQWRIPYGKNTASYNAGLNSAKYDQKGSYIYGKKEIKYIKQITTKTHIALFDLSARRDSHGVLGENGSDDYGQEMYQIDAIRLYAKPEYEKYQNDLIIDPGTTEIQPIKTAHFVYNYSLCGNLPSNDGQPEIRDLIDINFDRGKLTLEKVYFTYRSSLMGKHTPYTFDYNADDLNHNPDYSLKAFDVWGNYKPNEGSCDATNPENLTTSEYPFVDQENKTTQNEYASAWSLTSINLPSGGAIDLTYESDDYQYVQDKHTMQMFKVVGAGNRHLLPNDDPESNQLLYNGSVGEATHLYVKLPDETEEITPDVFIQKYLKDQEDKPIYFRFLMNMTKKGAQLINTTDFDYVTGYFQIEKNLSGESDVSVFKDANDGIYASIKMEPSELEGGVRGGSHVNPISKAGWYFGRTYLNKVVYGMGDYKTENIVAIAKQLAKSIGNVGEVFKGPNARLRDYELLCAQRFIPQKSWIRLSTPKIYKLGGGSRIKKLVMKDHWNAATSGISSSVDGQDYGQTYDYTLEDKSSSGVATFEPNDSAENPFVEPFYDLDHRLIAPREVSYVEKPFGKAFFPYSKVTYSRVTVKNLDRDDITRHATGKVVSEFYTTKDFPTKVEHTVLNADGYRSNEKDVLKNLIKGLLGQEVKVKKEFTLSQGYAIHTNDMDGKTKSQRVYQVGMDKPISSVEYKYSTKIENASNNEISNAGILNNVLTTISKKGDVSEKEIGVDYDVITDFRKSYSKSRTTGVNTNVVTFFIGLFPVIVPTAFPSRSEHENIAHSVITTKVVHTTAILKEKIAMDLGSKVSTVNEAWDAETGAVILTKTINEYDDAYYNFNFPAYWANQYKNMGQASKNLGLEGTLNYSGEYFTIEGVTKASKYLTLGDEIVAKDGTTPKRLWVVAFNLDESGVKLMDLDGVVEGVSEKVIDFKVVRSGYRNQQMGNMASITMMTNPLDLATNGKINTASFSQLDATASNNKRVINASAVAYDDFWNAQCENGLKSIPYKNTGTDTVELADKALEDYNFNPYLYNVSGEWRAEKSYAYLTERTDVKQGAETSKMNTRKEGYFKEFTPFYALEESGGEAYWKLNDSVINENNPDKINYWTFASEVTQYSPYGAELENKDALNRYSSAQYGYNFTLPTAVASNSRYRYMGSDNFEDYDYLNTPQGHFTYKDMVDQDGDGLIDISNKHAHTGNTSLLVNPDSPAGASLPVELIGEVPLSDNDDGDGFNNDIDKCRNTPSETNEDYDDNGIGDACDDYAEPTIKDAIYSNQFCRGKQALFTIHGKPNSVVDYAIIEQSSNPNGWWAHINGERISRDVNNKARSYTVTLDQTGRAIIEFQVVSKERNPGRADNSPARIQFQLLHRKTLNKLEGELVELSVIGYGHCSSGGNGPAIFTPI